METDATPPPPPTDSLRTWPQIARSKEAEYLEAHPEVIRFAKRTGGREGVHGPNDYEGDAGARAITLAIRAGHPPNNPRAHRNENGEPTDHPDTYRHVERTIHYIADRQADRKRSPSQRPKHAGWPVWERAIAEITGLRNRYTWAKGEGPLPTITQALEEYGSGIINLTHGRRWMWPAYIDEPTRTIYDLFDKRIRTTHHTEEHQEAAALTEEGERLYLPQGYVAKPRKTRHHYGVKQ